MAKKITSRVELGALLKQRRNELEMSLRDVADKLDLPRQRILEVENGKISSLDYYIKCAEVLGVSIYADKK